jgi:C-terminal processing protease CtpA/Prc
MSNSPADIISLRSGDVITGINGETIKDLGSFYKLLREKTKTELYFSVQRGENKLETMKFKR